LVVVSDMATLYTLERASIPRPDVADTTTIPRPQSLTIIPS
jgi:hypothetical protein